MPETVRPADAAGLVLLRGTGGATEVLMGRRNRKTRFMPDVYVFPGGRVDPADARASGFPEDLPGAPRGLDRATRARLAAFARAALRETFEETGLLVAREALGTTQAGSRPDSPRPAPEPWQAYRRAQLSPAFDALHLTARAITPTDSPIRYHTRFFRADGGLARGRLCGNGELVDLNWVPIAEVDRLPVVDVTQLVLREALAQRGTIEEPAAALYCWSRRARAPIRRSPRESAPNL